MSHIITEAKKWGDSIAIIIPKKIVEMEKIKPKDKLEIIIQKKVDLSEFFGVLNSKKTPQELKDEERSGWK